MADRLRSPSDLPSGPEADVYGVEGLDDCFEADSILAFDLGE